MNRISFIALITIAAAASGQTGDKRAVPLPPVSVAGQAATSIWRSVLAMSDSDREAFIASKPAAAQEYLRAKMKEYLALSPRERELRLQALERRAIMLPLMKMAPAVRAQHLQKLPSPMQQDITARLVTWDILPPPLQRDVLENETVARLFIESQTSGATREQVLAGVSPQRREAMESEFQRWDNLPVERREQVLNNVRQFFEQPERERARTLETLAAAERARLTPALSALDRLSPQKREQALSGFTKFKRLSLPEQQDFLRTAQRWEAMREKDRQLWREIVSSLHQQPEPPLPPPASSVRRVPGSSNE